MSNNSIHAIPFEILKKIFQCLKKERKDIKTCLSVCKLWQVAVREVYGLSIKVDEDSLKRLSKDIVSFAPKVKSITLCGSESITIVERMVTCLVWFNIILACPNLVSIIIHVSEDFSYVQCLMNTATERLGHIQYFETTTLQRHLQLNLMHYKTITSLLVTSLHFFSGQSSDNKLNYYVSLFPKLTSVNIKVELVHFNSVDVVDVIQLLETAPQLRHIRASNLNEIRSSSITTISDNSCLNSLILEVNKMDLNSLIFIITRLKRLHYLELDMGSLITDIPREKYEMEEELSESLFDDLKRFTSGITEFYIRFEFLFLLYILENGKEPYRETIFYDLLL